MLRWRNRRTVWRGGPRRAAVLAWLSDGDLRDVSATPGQGYYALPSVHPAGDWVTFHGAKAGRSRIWRTSLGDGTSEPLTSEELVACSPSYSADGAYITFSGYEVANHASYSMERAVHRLPGMGLYFGGVPYWMNLYLMKEDGSGLRKITAGRFYDTRPSFSPDGEHVVFLRRSGWPWGPRTMWRVSADGGRSPQPVFTEASVGRPVYSVDGASIYFFIDIKGRNRLAVMPSDGRLWRPLANDTLGAWSHGPFCDPDGSHLWYHCGVEGGSLCRLPLGGGEPIVMRPPGFEERSCAHASASKNGTVVFDWVEYGEGDDPQPQV